MINTDIRIYRILRELGGNRNNIQRGSRLIEDIGLDSFDMCCLINSIEYRCNVMIHDNDIRGLRTVGNVIDHVKMIHNYN